MKGSRLRAPRGRCPRLAAPGLPRRVVACTGADGAEALVLWERTVGRPAWQPLGPLLAPPRGWDLGAQERAFVGAELRAWPRPVFVRGRRPQTPGRPAGELPPLRQRVVVGDLAAALAELPGVAERKAMAKRAGEERRRALAGAKAA